MKYILILVLGIIFFASYVFYSTETVDPIHDQKGQQEQIDNESSQIDSMTPNDGELGNVEDSLNVLEQEGDSEISEEELIELKSKIDTLVLEYDNHLRDPERRAEIQEQIDVLMKEYNEMTLPLALEAMREK
jgi:hypothetical protein